MGVVITVLSVVYVSVYVYVSVVSKVHTFVTEVKVWILDFKKTLVKVKVST